MLRQIDALGLPVFVKPANLGSSVGISKVKTQDELVPAIELALQFDRKVVVEAAVPDAREIECAVLGNDDPKTSVPGEIMPSREFYDYEAKYLDDGFEDRDSRRPAAGHGGGGAAAGGRGVPRDRRAPAWRASTSCWRATPATIYLNEINTMPGFTTISMYSKMWEASGLAYARSSTG